MPTDSNAGVSSNYILQSRIEGNLIDTGYYRYVRPARQCRNTSPEPPQLTSHSSLAEFGFAVHQVDHHAEGAVAIVRHIGIVIPAAGVASR